MAGKRRKRSGLTGLELAMALNAIKDLVKKSRQEEALNMEVSEEDLEVSEELEQLEAVLKMLQSKADSPQSYSFSGMNFDLRAKMNISLSGLLELKADASHPDKPDSFGGAAGLWSVDMFYHHLQLLERLVPRTNEAAARLWINAFFFRVAVMTPNMLVSVEQGVPSVTLLDQSLDTVAGNIDWTTVIVKSTLTHQKFLQNALLRDLRSQDTVLFVSEAKGPDQRLQNHVPQAICGMYGRARTAGRNKIRGVLTNGRGWMFLILELNKDGGTYLQSTEIPIYIIENRKEKLSKDDASLISLIIAHWMKHSHKDLDLMDDYFTIAPNNEDSG